LIGTHWHRHVFLRDLEQGKTILISKGLSGEAGNHISGDVFVVSGGTSVVFSSAATNLIPIDLNGYSDIFVWDFVANRPQRP
jgi:hypothetical protein